MGFTNNEAYLFPRQPLAPERALTAARFRALIVDLLAPAVGAAPFALLTGEQVELPFSHWGATADLDSGRYDGDQTLAYWGDAADELLTAIDRVPWGHEELCVWFSSLDSEFVSPELATCPLLVYALPSARAFELDIIGYDEHFQEVHHVLTLERQAVVVFGHSDESLAEQQAGNKPPGALFKMLSRHLGPLDVTLMFLD